MGRELSYDSSLYRPELHSDIIYPGYAQDLYGFYGAEIFPDAAMIESVTDKRNSPVPRRLSARKTSGR